MLDMLKGWQDGRAKLAVIAILLGYRRDHSKLFAQGSYEPLIATGSKADQICAFARSYQQDVLVVAVARFSVRSEADRDWAVGRQTHWRDLFGGRVVERRGEGVGVEAVLGDMPVAVLVPITADTAKYDLDAKPVSVRGRGGNSAVGGRRAERARTWSPARA